MSANVLLFTVTLKQLSADCTKAGADQKADLFYVSPDQLRKLLRALQTTAATVEPPLEPEMRIEGPTGKFVVRAKLGEMQLVSWSSAHRGGKVSPDDVIAAVTSTEAADEPAPKAAKGTPGRTARSGGQKENKLALVGLGLAIVAVNAFTIWFITRPPRTLTDSYTLLPATEAERVFNAVAGFYETGRGTGDRRLEIAKDGSVQRIKFGASGAPRDKQAFTTKAAEAEGKSALVTNKKTLIRVKDPTAVMLYGDTYQKVSN
jgi:hypothetical protein